MDYRKETIGGTMYPRRPKGRSISMFDQPAVDKALEQMRDKQLDDYLEEKRKNREELEKEEKNKEDK